MTSFDTRDRKRFYLKWQLRLKKMCVFAFAVAFDKCEWLLRIRNKNSVQNVQLTWGKTTHATTHIIRCDSYLIRTH